MTSAHKTPLALAVVAAALMMMASPGAYALSINTSDGSTLSPPGSGCTHAHHGPHPNAHGNPDVPR